MVVNSFLNEFAQFGQISHKLGQFGMVCVRVQQEMKDEPANISIKSFLQEMIVYEQGLSMLPRRQAQGAHHVL